MKMLIARSAFRYVYKNPLQSVLSILGIALGVALVVAVDLSNESSERAFELSMESVTGKATHILTSSTNSVQDSIYRYLRVNLGFADCAPVVEETARIASDSNSTYTLLGVDPFAEKDFRGYLNMEASSAFNMEHFITSTGAAVVSKSIADRLHIEPGDTFNINLHGVIKPVFLDAIIKPSPQDAAKLENLIITDISTAQTLTEMPNEISRIDAIIPNDSVYNFLRSKLPIAISINKSESKTTAGEQLTSSFKTNLTAMSMLALIVGIFLIYNAMTFSVVRRKRLIGLLRSIGVTRQEIFRMIIIESIAIGAIGTILGVVAGAWLGGEMVKLVTKTINDMYFSLSVQDSSISTFSIIKGSIAGVLASVIAAVKPAREASRIEPATATRRSAAEVFDSKKIKKYALWGALIFLIGIAILEIPSKNIYLVYIGVFPVIGGSALIVPILTTFFAKLFAKPMAALFGSEGKIAARGVYTQLSRTGIAIAALGISVSSVIGFGLMITSFRNTVIDWLENTLEADIYISVPTTVSRFNDGTFPYEASREVARIPDVERMNVYRETKINYHGKIYHLLAAKVQHFMDGKLLRYDQSYKHSWDLFRNHDNLIVSETFAFKNDAEVGDTTYLPTDLGLKPFRIAAVYTDYSSDIGLVMINYPTFRRYYNDSLLSGMAVYGHKGANIDELKKKIENTLGMERSYIVRSNKSLIKSSVEIFDRTFLVTKVLQLLAIIVSFIGIFSALMALELEKVRELGIMRALGYTPREVRRIILTQTALMGFIAGIISLPLGSLLAYILTLSINRRSFGWTIHFGIYPDILLQALIISVAAALIAGLYPAWKMSKVNISLAVRDE